MSTICQAPRYVVSAARDCAYSGGRADLSLASFWILTALAYGRSHKHALAKTVADLSRGDLRIPLQLLTPLLNELEYVGLVSYDGDELVDGRFLRFLVLSARGSTALARYVEALEYRASIVRAVLPAPVERQRRTSRT